MEAMARPADWTSSVEMEKASPQADSLPTLYTSSCAKATFAAAHRERFAIGLATKTR